MSGKHRKKNIGVKTMLYKHRYPSLCKVNIKLICYLLSSLNRRVDVFSTVVAEVDLRDLSFTPESRWTFSRRIMGVAGLTTYIYHRENIYFDEVFLKDCALLIDGNSLAPYLFNSGLVHTSAFGGDYDRLGELTEKFFRRLALNNIYPIVVFDGAVEKRKVNTIKTRAKNKLLSLQNVTPYNSNSQCFPLLMRKAMREKLIDMGIVILQTDFEADSEIAALSKILQVPVLSNDSDYFIFDVLYIPIPTLDYGNATNSPIKCKMFRMDKFLRHLDIDVKRLPLLAVILGNDYIPRVEFRQFLGQIKIEKCRRSTRSQKVVAGVLRWLKSESVETGLQKILSCLRSRGRSVLRQKMIKIMRGYTNLTTVLTEYLPDISKIRRFDLPLVDSQNDEIRTMSVASDHESDLESDDDPQPVKTMSQMEEGSSSDDVNYNCSSDEGVTECQSINVAEVEAILEAGQMVSASFPDEIFPEWLKYRSRLGLVNPDILSLLNLKSFFSTPQPECYEMTFSGEPYMRVLQCIAGFLLGTSEIHCWYRQHRNKYEETVMNTITETQLYGKFPGLGELENLSCQERKTLFLEIMDVKEMGLSGVPDEWKLYMISISYWLKNDPNNELKPYHLHSVIIMMLTLLVVDRKIGFHRQRKSFVKKHGVAVGKISKSRENVRQKTFPVFDSICDALGKISKEDCLLIFESLLQNFQVDRRLRYSKHFSSTVVHSFARFQHCLIFTSMLNTVLSSPYPDVKINAFYNGTFLYNTAINLKKRANVVAYVNSSLASVPSLLGLYNIIYETFQRMCPELQEVKPRKKSRKTKTAPLSEAPKEVVKFDSDSEPFYDKNNRFCVIFT